MNDVLTTGAVAREAGISERRVRLYADAGLIKSGRDSSGRRVFDRSAPAEAQAVFRQRTRRIRRG
jgi:DNA-binding transcriptional MerR regulator